jgi:hypothetical protein
MAVFRRYNTNVPDVINSFPIQAEDFVVRFDVTPHGPIVGISTSYDSYTWASDTDNGDLPAMYRHDINIPLTFTGILVDTGIPVTVIEWFWDFGDGVTATGNDASHTYRYANLSTVAHLRATDSQGRQAWSSMNLMLQGDVANPVMGGGGIIIG